MNSNLFRHVERTREINLDTNCRAIGFFLLCFCPPPDLPASADTVGLTNVPAAAFVVRVSSETSNRFRLSPVIIREVMRSAVSAVSHLNETVASSGQS